MQNPWSMNIIFDDLPTFDEFCAEVEPKIIDELVAEVVAEMHEKAKTHAG